MELMNLVLVEMSAVDSQSPYPTALLISAKHEEDTATLARAFARAALQHMSSDQTNNQRNKGLSLYLHGTLGAGKTTFVRYFLRELGVTGRIKSPTYGLAESYEITPQLSLWHFDFYRLEKPNEWQEAGFAELWSQPCIRLVEWPEKAADTLPAADVRLEIEMDVNDASTRSFKANAMSAAGAAWLADIHKLLGQRKIPTP